jgi:hypothetical protein
VEPKELPGALRSNFGCTGSSAWYRNDQSVRVNGKRRRPETIRHDKLWTTLIENFIIFVNDNLTWTNSIELVLLAILLVC